MSRRVAPGRLSTVVLAAVLVVAAPSSRAEAPESRPARAAEPNDAFAVRFPYGEGLLSTTARLFGSQAYRAIERSRPVSDPAALATLTALLLGTTCWRFPARRPGSRRSRRLSLPFAGPRAPPLQLA